MPTGSWIFAALRYTTNSELAVFQSRSSSVLKTATTVCIPASAQANEAEFAIGSRSGSAFYVDGKLGMTAVYNSALTDSQIYRIHDLTRLLYSGGAS